MDLEILNVGMKDFTEEQQDISALHAQQTLRYVSKGFSFALNSGLMLGSFK